jgi:hypothetical protein
MPLDERERAELRALQDLKARLVKWAGTTHASDAVAIAALKEAIKEGR